MNEMTGKDVYLRVTNTATGATSVRHHRAWDVDRFIEAQRQAHRVEGEKEENPLLWRVELASAQEYRSQSARSAS